MTVKTRWLADATGLSGILSLAVTYTGIGFDPARTEALFSPFTQADGSVTRSFGGTGLGLAITRSLLQLMGGQITAEGRPGQGATFIASLPAKTAQTLVLPASPILRSHAKDSAAVPAAGAKVVSVLLVEDHEINRKLASILLGRVGYHCELAHDDRQALALLAQQRFDVVLMDVMMPVMDGLAALRQLREQEAQERIRTPVLMLTAHAMTGDKERFIAAGADGYVSKPMFQEALQKEIMRVTAMGDVSAGSKPERPNS